MFHYTDKAGYNAIKSQVDWKFLASQPPGEHPRGAYFTTLTPEKKKLAERLRIPKEKCLWFLSFDGDAGLKALEGGRGDYILYSPTDYVVPQGRQREHGANPSFAEDAK